MHNRLTLAARCWSVARIAGPLAASATGRGQTGRVKRERRAAQNVRSKHNTDLALNDWKRSPEAGIQASGRCANQHLRDGAAPQGTGSSSDGVLDMM